MTDRKRVFRLVWINTGIVLFVAVLLIAGAIYFTSKKTTELNTQLAGLKEKETAMTQKQKELPNISMHLPRLLNESKKVSMLFPTDTAQKELVDFLQQNVDKAGADVVSIAMDPPKELPVLKKSTATQTDEEQKLDKDIIEKTKFMLTGVEVRGSFENVLAFMENLKRSNRFYRILKIEGKPEKAQNVGGGNFISGQNLLFDLQGEMFITGEKLDIAAEFAKLRDELNRVLAISEPVETAPTEPGLLEVKPGGSGEPAPTGGPPV
jgi:Tfp pilus assembly protein PilN